MPEAEQALARRALPLLDLTDLSDHPTEAAIEILCAHARDPRGPVAAVCVWPQFVSLAARLLHGSGVRVATVANFPRGGTNGVRVAEDIRESLSDGADEIDLVMPWRVFLEGDETAAAEMIAEAAGLMEERHRLKVILETGAYPDTAAIERASRLAIVAGAHFLKTSTGKIEVSATLEAAETMLLAIRDSGAAVGVKLSGGIRTLGDAGPYLDLADRIMGPAWATPATFRFGASGLHEALLAALPSPDPAREA